MDTAKLQIDIWLKNGDPNVTLNLSHLNLTELPVIPPECKKLDCSNNKLTTIPNADYHELSCFCNNITKLPKLPNCQILACFDNKLTELPDLPECERLNCHTNNLTKLPKLPKCHLLSCNKNKLTQLPELPSYVAPFGYDSNTGVILVKFKPIKP